MRILVRVSCGGEWTGRRCEKRTESFDDLFGDNPGRLHWLLMFKLIERKLIGVHKIHRQIVTATFNVNVKRIVFTENNNA